VLLSWTVVPLSWTYIPFDAAQSLTQIHASGCWRHSRWIRNRIDGQVDSRVEDQVDNQVDNRVDDQVDNRVDNQVEIEGMIG